MSFVDAVVEDFVATATSSCVVRSEAGTTDSATSVGISIVSGLQANLTLVRAFFVASSSVVSSWSSLAASCSVGVTMHSYDVFLSLQDVFCGASRYSNVTSRAVSEAAASVGVAVSASSGDKSLVEARNMTFVALNSVVSARCHAGGESNRRFFAASSVGMALSSGEHLDVPRIRDMTFIAVSSQLDTSASRCASSLGLCVHSTFWSGTMNNTITGLMLAAFDSRVATAVEVSTASTLGVIINSPLVDRLHVSDAMLVSQANTTVMSTCDRLCALLSLYTAPPTKKGQRVRVQSVAIAISASLVISTITTSSTLRYCRDCSVASFTVGTDVAQYANNTVGLCNANLSVVAGAQVGPKKSGGSTSEVIDEYYYYLVMMGTTVNVTQSKASTSASSASTCFSLPPSASTSQDASIIAFSGFSNCTTLGWAELTDSSSGAGASPNTPARGYFRDVEVRSTNASMVTDPARLFAGLLPVTPPSLTDETQRPVIRAALLLGGAKESFSGGAAGSGEQWLAVPTTRDGLNCPILNIAPQIAWLASYDAEEASASRDGRTRSMTIASNRGQTTTAEEEAPSPLPISNTRAALTTESTANVTMTTMSTASTASMKPGPSLSIPLATHATSMSTLPPRTTMTATTTRTTTFIPLPSPHSTTAESMATPVVDRHSTDNATTALWLTSSAALTAASGGSSIAAALTLAFGSPVAASTASKASQLGRTLQLTSHCDFTGGGQQQPGGDSSSPPLDDIAYVWTRDSSWNPSTAMALWTTSGVVAASLGLAVAYAHKFSFLAGLFAAVLAYYGPNEAGLAASQLSASAVAASSPAATVASIAALIISTVSVAISSYAAVVALSVGSPDEPPLPILAGPDAPLTVETASITNRDDKKATVEEARLSEAEKPRSAPRLASAVRFLVHGWRDDPPERLHATRRLFGVIDIAAATLAAVVSSIHYGSTIGCAAAATVVALVYAAQVAYVVAVRPQRDRHVHIASIANACGMIVVNAFAVAVVLFPFNVMFASIVRVTALVLTALFYAELAFELCAFAYHRLCSRRTDGGLENGASPPFTTEIEMTSSSCSTLNKAPETEGRPEEEQPLLAITDLAPPSWLLSKGSSTDTTTTAGGGGGPGAPTLTPRPSNPLGRQPQQPL